MISIHTKARSHEVLWKSYAVEVIQFSCQIFRHHESTQLISPSCLRVRIDDFRLFLSGNGKTIEHPAGMRVAGDGFGFKPERATWAIDLPGDAFAADTHRCFKGCDG